MKKFITWHIIISLLDIKKIAISSILLAICLAAWFLPQTGILLNRLDINISIFLNQFIGQNYWTYFWGVFNKNFENYLNQVVMILIMIYHIWQSDKKTHSIAQLITTYSFLLLGIFLMQLIFIDILNIRKPSPTLSIPNFVNISHLLEDPGIKSQSNRSFPSGHGFAMFYWAIFTASFLPKNLSSLAWIAAIFFSLPRLMVGAHWPSDIVASIFIANLYVQLIISTPLYFVYNSVVEKIIKNIMKYCGSRSK